MPGLHTVEERAVPRHQSNEQRYYEALQRIRDASCPDKIAAEKNMEEPGNLIIELATRYIMLQRIAREAIAGRRRPTT